MQQLIKIDKLTGSCCGGESGRDGGDGATEGSELGKGREDGRVCCGGLRGWGHCGGWHQPVDLLGKERGGLVHP